MSETLSWPDRLVKRTYEKAEFLATLYNRRNYRLHPDQQKAVTEGSLDKLGWISSIKIGFGEWGKRCFDGHLRIEIALLKFGADTMVPVEWYDLSEEETDQALLLHDTTTGMADIDFGILDDLVKNTPALDIPEFDDFLKGMFDNAGEALNSGNGDSGNPEPGSLTDKAEELLDKWQVEPGQIWAIGDHRLICGDCRELSTWERLLAGQKVNGVFTSPPYAQQRKNDYGGVPVDEYTKWWEAVQGTVRQNLVKDGSFFVNIKPHSENKSRVLYVFELVLAMVREWGWVFIDELCWRHWGYPQGVVNKFKNCFEPIYHFGLDPDRGEDQAG